jgi:hypothetical protein
MNSNINQFKEIITDVLSNLFFKIIYKNELNDLVGIDNDYIV